MRIIAVPDRLVRDPSTRRVVDAEGIIIDPADPHWSRLLADGDVAEAPGAEPEPGPDYEALPEPVSESAHEESAT